MGAHSDLPSLGQGQRAWANLELLGIGETEGFGLVLALRLGEPGACLEDVDEGAVEIAQGLLEAAVWGLLELVKFGLEGLELARLGLVADRAARA